MRRYLPFLIIGIVLLVTAGGGLLLLRSKLSSTPLNLIGGKPGAEPSHVRGGANARVTLEEFGDFQCPPCGVLAATLLKVEHDYAESVRVVFRQFPLPMHTHAMTAASAAEAAGLQGHFWEMHDLLFANSKTWGRPAPLPSGSAPLNGPPPSAETAANIRAIFSGYATQLGLDLARFNRDMETEEVKARIKLDQERGESVGVDRTPFLFLNGAQVPFVSMGEPELRGVIDAVLSGKPPPPPQSPTPAAPQSAPPVLPFNPIPSPSK